MVRKLTHTAPPPALQARPGDRERTDTIYMLTPLCGGGTTAHQNDASLLIRGTSVRGQLRFWWRAARAGEFMSVADMRKQEAAIWGSVDAPAAVNVAIAITDQGKPGQGIKAFDNSVVPAYAAFPLTANRAVGQAQENVVFTLTLRYPDQFAQDVETALWAWTTFGGIGARTRRGFGALDLESACSLADTQARLKDPAWVAQRVPCEPGIPSLYQAKLVLGKADAETQYDAWYDGIDKLKDFRQARRPGNGPKPGRSFWGEPDALRTLTKNAAPAHSEPVNNVSAFPRAVFGLPIIYQFKDKSEGDPGPQTLEGGEARRLASPLLIRPLRLGPGKYRAMALQLTNSFQDPVGLVPGGLKLPRATVRHQLTRDDVANLKAQRNLPVALSHLEPDVLAAFLAWFAD